MEENVVGGWLRKCWEGISRLRPRRLLTAAAILHVTLSVLIYLVGRFNLLPGMFDANGLSSPLAFDSFYYRRKSILLVAALMQGNFAEWLSAPYPLHVKFYSLSFAVLSPLLDYTMLSVEPLNLFYYLLILTLVFKLGEETFDRRAGLLAAVVVALWPSLLLHTTQLLRDPLYIVVTLGLLLIAARWLTKDHSLRRGLLEALPGGAASAVIWITRYNVWAITVGFISLGVVLLVIRQLGERRWLAGNVAGAVLLLVMMSVTPAMVGRYFTEDSALVDPEMLLVEQPLPPPSPCANDPQGRIFVPTEKRVAGTGLMVKVKKVVARISDFRRKAAIFYADAGSNLDMCVRFGGVADLLRYLPRAVANGFLAPYPDMWLSRGSTTGRSGRLLSGLEMLAIYLIELSAIMGLWRGRRRLSIWFIALVSVAGITALGVVVINVAVLFRVRYVFLILLLVIGAGWATQLSSPWPRAKASRKMV